MDLFQALILGIVQGATEYIPVSSTAHLILVPWFLGWPDPSDEFLILIQLGTLIGVFIFFWQDIWGIIRGIIQGLITRQPLGTFEAKLGWLVFVASLPSVLGLIPGFEELFKKISANPQLTGGFLILTAILLTVVERSPNHSRDLKALSWLDAVIIGFWQVAAILPGISRSGATISGAVLRNFDRPTAARFSFLMSIPALLAAGGVAFLGLLQEGTVTSQLPAISVGFVAAAVSGYFCIRWLLHYLQRHSLYVFAIYCLILSIFSIIFGFFQG